MGAKISFLGTGDAGGVPRYGCECPACLRAQSEPRYQRRQSSLLIESGATRVLIDAGLTDLTQRFPPGSLSAIVVTHFHPDHVQGLLHLRWGLGKKLPVFTPPDPEGCADLYKHPGMLEFRTLKVFEPLCIGELQFVPLPLIHSKMTFGYAIEDTDARRFAYLTDTVGLPELTEEFLLNWQAHAIALDCTHPPRTAAARNHCDLTLALTIAEALKPSKTLLTHIGHTMDAWLMNNEENLPAHVSIAHDLLAIEDSLMSGATGGSG